MLPKDISTIGYYIDNVILLIFIITLSVGLFSFGVLIYTAIKFRHSKHPRATYKIKNFASFLTKLVLVMLVFDILIDIFSTRAWQETIAKSEEEIIKENEHRERVYVGVIGRQFFWAFTYAGRDNKLGSNDDFTLANHLVVPKDTLVLLKLTSGDVIHSFFAPNLRLKYDVVPGREFTKWFIAKETGVYEITCAELCGPEHFRMNAKLEVMSKEDYQKWLEDRYGLGEIR